MTDGETGERCRGMDDGWRLDDFDFELDPSFIQAETLGLAIPQGLATRLITHISKEVLPTLAILPVRLT